MKTFNVGDRVRFIEQGFLWSNMEGTVTGHDPDNDSHNPRIKFDAEYNMPCPYGRDWQFDAGSLTLINNGLEYELQQALAPLFKVAS